MWNVVVHVLTRSLREGAAARRPAFKELVSLLCLILLMVRIQDGDDWGVSDDEMEEDGMSHNEEEECEECEKCPHHQVDEE